MLIKKLITAKKLIYKVIKTLTANYKMLKKFIINKNKLFTLKY